MKKTIVLFFLLLIVFMVGCDKASDKDFELYDVVTVSIESNDRIIFKLNADEAILEKGEIINSTLTISNLYNDNSEDNGYISGYEIKSSENVDNAVYIFDPSTSVNEHYSKYSLTTNNTYTASVKIIDEIKIQKNEITLRNVKDEFIIQYIMSDDYNIIEIKGAAQNVSQIVFDVSNNFLTMKSDKNISDLLVSVYDGEGNLYFEEKFKDVVELDKLNLLGEG